MLVSQHLTLPLVTFTTTGTCGFTAHQRWISRECLHSLYIVKIEETMYSKETWQGFAYTVYIINMRFNCNDHL